MDSDSADFNKRLGRELPLGNTKGELSCAGGIESTSCADGIESTTINSEVMVFEVVQAGFQSRVIMKLWLLDFKVFASL